MVGVEGLCSIARIYDPGGDTCDVLYPTALYDEFVQPSCFSFASFFSPIIDCACAVGFGNSGLCMAVEV